MAILVKCPHCERELRLKDRNAGLTGPCPFCKEDMYVPILNDLSQIDDTRQPTEEQLGYASRLRIAIPQPIGRDQLSILIDQAKEHAPATEKQLQFLRELGVAPKEGLKCFEISMLIDAALNLRDQVSKAVRKNVENEFLLSGQALENTPTLDLLKEIENRGLPFVALVLEDEEFHYQQGSRIAAALRWSSGLARDDVFFLILSLAKWAISLDLERYAEEYDGELPTVSFNAHELPLDTTGVELFYGDDGID